MECSIRGLWVVFHPIAWSMTVRLNEFLAYVRKDFGDFPSDYLSHDGSAQCTCTNGRFWAFEGSTWADPKKQARESEYQAGGW